MEKDVYISEKLYTLINDIAEVNDSEQMMVFGGKTVGNTIVINEKSFNHFNDESVLNSSKEHMEVSVNDIKKYMELSKELGNDTFFMTHSHKIPSV
jgi:hypothetical protein